jgi:hypothetical protein
VLKIAINESEVLSSRERLKPNWRSFISKQLVKAAGLAANGLLGTISMIHRGVYVGVYIDVLGGHSCGVGMLIKRCRCCHPAAVGRKRDVLTACVSQVLIY